MLSWSLDIIYKHTLHAEKLAVPPVRYETSNYHFIFELIPYAMLCNKLTIWTLYWEVNCNRQQFRDGGGKWQLGKHSRWHTWWWWCRCGLGATVVMYELKRAPPSRELVLCKDDHEMNMTFKSPTYVDAGSRYREQTRASERGRSRRARCSATIDQVCPFARTGRLVMSHSLIEGTSD